MYANGVFATLGQMNKDMRNVCKFIVQAYASSHEELPRKRFTFQEPAPWIEVEIVHGRLKLTGYSVAWSNTNFPLGRCGARMIGMFQSRNGKFSIDM